MNQGHVLVHRRIVAALANPAARGVWMVVGAVLTTLTITATALHLGAFALGVQQQTDRSLFDGPLRTLSVHTDSGRIDVRPAEPGGPGTLLVEAQRSGAVGLPEVRTERTGDRLSLDGRCGFPFGAAIRCEVSFVLHVPPGLRLRLDSGSGRIELGAIAFADLAADTGSGEIRADGTSGPATYRTGSGRVYLTDVSGPSADVRTGSGRIEAEDLSVGDVVLDTGSGAIGTRFATAPTRLDAVTGSGEITVTVPPGDSYDVDADPGSGRADVRVTQDPASPRSVRLRTGSGRITLTYAP